MNWVDLLIVALLVLALVRGVATGAAVQVLAFGGIAAGIGLGLVVAPGIGGLASNPLLGAALSLLAVLALVGLLGGVGESAGRRLAGGLRRGKAGGLDALLGGGVAVAATLAVIWLIGGIVAAIPVQGPLAAVHRSEILEELGQRLPPAPPIASRLGALLTRAGFPSVFAELEPSPAPDVALPPSQAIREAVAAAGRSTVKIVSMGCGGVRNGSGFVAASDLVVTNAHVVAGMDRVQVEDRAGAHPASTVLFDPKLDIAVLRTDGLVGPSLSLAEDPVGRGTVGAVLGYPGGGRFQAEPAAVRARLQAVGRDIYGSSLVVRRVYQLEAGVKPGNSGGPFVLPEGSVAGVVFSVSTLDDQLAYALVSTEVAPLVSEARGRRSAVDTGPCLR